MAPWLSWHLYTMSPLASWHHGSDGIMVPWLWWHSGTMAQLSLCHDGSDCIMAPWVSWHYDTMAQLTSWHYGSAWIMASWLSWLYGTVATSWSGFSEPARRTTLLPKLPCYNEKKKKKMMTTRDTLQIQLCSTLLLFKNWQYPGEPTSY